MKIVNLEDFRKLPAGTLFMKYEHCVFGELQAKGETLEHDFLVENITYEIDGGDFGGKIQELYEAVENKTSVTLDFDCASRDGLFNDDQLFAIYEKVDVEMLQDKLRRCVESAYNTCIMQ